MAKFCTKCGRRLIDGQPCSCTQTQQPVHDMQESVQKEVKDKAKNFFTQALEMIKHPSKDLWKLYQTRTVKTD